MDLYLLKLKKEEENDKNNYMEDVDINKKIEEKTGDFSCASCLRKYFFCCC